MEQELPGTEILMVFQAGCQQWKVCGMFWFGFALFLASLKWGYDLSQTYGLSPGDGGVLRPLGERLAWGGFVILLGAALVAGLELYGRLYICRVQFDRKVERVLFETVRWWGYQRIDIPVGEIVGSSYHAGDFETLKHTVNAPWYFVQLGGHRLPLILDGQGKFLMPGLAASLLNL